MRYCCILLAIVICSLPVDGRNIYEQNIDNEKNENVEINHLNRPGRRTRNRRNSYKYHDVNSYQIFEAGDLLKNILFSVREIETHVRQGVTNRHYPSYYDNRHDYSNKCEDSVKELLSLYKELALHLKYTPTPPPQIIYVPYPIPSTFNHPVDKTPVQVNITDRNVPNDRNQIWMATPKSTDTEDDGDGSRDISFKPQRPKRPLIRPPPPFEHGSTQAGMETTTPAALKKPEACKAAILSCCGSKSEQEQENCFALYRCSKLYKTGLACNPAIIEMVLEDFSKVYGPVNEF